MIWFFFCKCLGQEARDGMQSTRMKLSNDCGDMPNLFTLRACSSSVCLLLVNGNSIILHLYLRYVMMGSQALGKILPGKRKEKMAEEKEKYFDQTCGM